MRNYSFEVVFVNGSSASGPLLLYSRLLDFNMNCGAVLSVNPMLESLSSCT